MAFDRFAAYILAKKNQNFPSFIVKMAQKMDSKPCQKCICCFPQIFFFSPEKGQKMLFQLEKVGSKLV